MPDNEEPQSLGEEQAKAVEEVQSIFGQSKSPEPDSAAAVEEASIITSESNHDAFLTYRSSYPFSIKNRGDLAHLVADGKLREWIDQAKIQKRLRFPWLSRFSHDINQPTAEQIRRQAIADALEKDRNPMEASGEEKQRLLDEFNQLITAIQQKIANYPQNQSDHKNSLALQTGRNISLMSLFPKGDLFNLDASEYEDSKARWEVEIDPPDVVSPNVTRAHYNEKANEFHSRVSIPDLNIHHLNDFPYTALTIAKLIFAKFK